MLIRPATAEDVPQVLPMVAKICALHESWDAAKYGFRENVVQMYRGWLTSRARDSQSVFLVAQREQSISSEPRAHQLAGFVVGAREREIPIYRIERFGFIHDLWVEPEFRNEGIRRQLAMVAIEKLRQM